MDELRKFLNSLSVSEQADFAARCGTTVGYLRKAISIGQSFSGELVIAIEDASNGVIRAETLRPDVRWHVIRGKAECACQDTAA